MKRDRENYTDYDLPDQEDYFDDYWAGEPQKPVRPMSDEERELYYARLEAYYAKKDAYYARRDAYYAARDEEEDEYAGDYDDDDGGYAPVRSRSRAPVRKKRRRKKRHVFRTLLLLLIIGGITALLLGTPPVRNPGDRPREAGRSNLLLAATDLDGSHTDVIILLSLKQGGGLRLLGIPRETYDPYCDVPRIDTAWAEGGVDELLRAVTDVAGFTPDAYVLVDLDFFVRAADLLGGVDFDLPGELFYEEELRALQLGLTAGEQHLDGRQAVELARYLAVTGRTDVLRDLLRAALTGWIRPSLAGKLPELWSLYLRKAASDLSVRNMLWIARVLVKTDPENVPVDVLPGREDMAGEVPVFIVNREAARQTLENYDPYQ